MITALGVELYPADDHCVQGCADCPRAFKNVQQLRETPFYSERAMAILNKFRGCSVITDVQFASISSRNAPQNIIAFPQILSTRSFVFGIGPIPAKSNSSEVNGFADKVFENASLCLQDQAKDRPIDVNFSVVPDLDKDLILKNVDALREFFSRLLKKVASEEFPFLVSHVIFGLSANDVNRGSLVNSISDFSKVQKTQTDLRKLILDLTREGGTCLEVLVESLSQDSEVAVRRDTASVMCEAYGRVSISQRLIEENKGKEQNKKLDIEKRDLNVALFNDYAWLYHSKDVVADKSLFIPYAELEKILDECIMNRNLTLHKELNSWIGRKRGLLVT